MKSLSGVKIEQLAFGVSSMEEWEKHAATAKVVDKVIFDGSYRHSVNHPWVIIQDKVGHLCFNYGQGLEMEYLHYPDVCDTFHSHITTHPYPTHYLSHVGAHCEDIDKWLEEDLIDNGPDSIAHRMIMDVRTKEHSNEYLRSNGRKYRYVIFDCRAETGFFWKLIQRIEAPIVLDRNI